MPRKISQNKKKKRRMNYGVAKILNVKMKNVNKNILYFNSVMISLLVLSFYGYHADYIPTISSNYFGLSLSIIISITISIVFYVAIWRGRIPLHETSRIKKTFVFIFLPFFIFIFFSMAISHGIPAICTNMLGDKSTIVAQVYKALESDKYEDFYVIKGDIIENAFPEHICISESDFYSLPDTFLVKLIGKETPLGFLVKKVIMLNKDFDSRSLILRCE